MKRCFFPGIGACNLKKGIFFSPDPYVKFKISPRTKDVLTYTSSTHHGQHCRTSVKRNTVDPIWEGEQFMFTSYMSDWLEVEIKDKFAKSRPTISRNLGKLKIAIRQLLENVGPQ